MNAFHALVSALVLHKNL